MICIGVAVSRQYRLSLESIYFDEQTGEFAGTETLLRADAFRGNRQCPTESGGWFFIPPLGYYGCHRN